MIDCTRQVLVEEATPDSMPVFSGVSQGTVLCPLLFLMFLNDLPHSVQSRTRLFANDCILYRQIKSQQDQDILKEDVNKPTAWNRKREETDFYNKSHWLVMFHLWTYYFCINVFAEKYALTNKLPAFLAARDGHLWTYHFLHKRICL